MYYNIYIQFLYYEFDIGYNMIEWFHFNGNATESVFGLIQ